MIRIDLDLSRHCIQTETRRIYNRLVSECLQSAEIDGDMEEKVDFLVHVLETFDFAQLRSAYPELAGGGGAEVALIREDSGRLAIQIDDRVVAPWLA
ncbi:MAG: hypothetical protein ACLFPD_00875 [Desulfosudaceae bacterium]